MLGVSVSLKGALTGHDLLIKLALLEDSRIQIYLMAAIGGKVTDK